MSPRHQLARSALELLAVGTVASVGIVVVGVPDVAGAVHYLSGVPPTAKGAVALAATLCWVVMVGIALVLLADSAQQLIRRRRRMGRTLRATTLLVVAAVVLTVAVLRHAQTAVLCCAHDDRQLQEAVSLAR